MNINNIIKGMADSIVSAFPDTVVMDETIEDNTPLNGFNIRCISPSHRPVNNKRRKCTDQFSVTYYPEETKYNNTTNDLYEALERCLEVIAVDGGKVRGYDMDAVTTDGVLVLTVTYDYYTEDTEEPVMMESYWLKEIIHGKS